MYLRGQRGCVEETFRTTFEQQKVLHALLKPEKQNYSDACSSTAPKTGGESGGKGDWKSGIKIQLQ